MGDIGLSVQFKAEKYHLKTNTKVGLPTLLSQFPQLLKVMSSAAALPPAFFPAASLPSPTKLCLWELLIVVTCHTACTCISGASREISESPKTLHRLALSVLLVQFGKYPELTSTLHYKCPIRDRAKCSYGLLGWPEALESSGQKP